MPNLNFPDVTGLYQQRSTTKLVEFSQYGLSKPAQICFGLKLPSINKAGLNDVFQRSNLSRSGILSGRTRSPAISIVTVNPNPEEYVIRRQTAGR